MSGGTDSSVAAILLLEQGYEVEGVTLITYSADAVFISEAKALADKLGINHHVLDVRNEFKEIVVDYFIDEYRKGRTPNPCIRCNEKLKWASLVRLADKLGIVKIATGHYVNLDVRDSYFYIIKGKDKIKDQSYFLWHLPQLVLKRAYFPLGQLTKSEVKYIAKDRGYLKLLEKKESMGVCFLEGTDVSSFLKEAISEVQGYIVDFDGEILGNHNGTPFYTIGQKRGLNLTKSANVCVVKIDVDENKLIVDNPDSLWCDNVRIENFSFVNKDEVDEAKSYNVRIRGLDRVPYHKAWLKVIGDDLVIYFEEKVWALTPGQSIVVYDDDRLIGGGVFY